MISQQTIVGRFEFITIHQILLGSCYLTVMAILWLASVHNVNWDEFHYLAQIHAYTNNEPLQPLQTFHVHIFRWLTLLPFDEIGQITVARLFMLVLLVVTTAMIYQASCQFVSPTYALFGSLAFLSSGYVISHGASFRTDPIAACCLMIGLTIYLRSRLKIFHLCMVAICCSLAMLITIKSTLYAPAFLAIAIYRHKDIHIIRKTLAIAFMISMAFYCTLMLHEYMLVQMDRVASDVVLSAWKTTILESGVLPRLQYVKTWVILSTGLLWLVAVALIRTKGLMKIVVLLLFLPILSVIFYRNAFPYFFPFIIPPLCMVTAVGISRISIESKIPQSIVILMLIGSMIQVWLAAQNDQNVQRDLLAVVQHAFPEPVTYIDRNSMISTFPKVGFFMTSLGMKKYRDQNKAVFEQLLIERSPPLLLANGPALVAAMFDIDEFSKCCGLLKADVDALKDNYVPYWGWVWIAGKSMLLENGNTVITMIIPGTYRLESSSPIKLNGAVVQPYENIDISRGSVRLETETRQSIKLVWSTSPPPETAPVMTSPYANFLKL